MNVNLNKQGVLSSNIFIESPAINHIIVTDSDYAILVDSNGESIVDSFGRNIYLMSDDRINIEDALDYLAGLSSLDNLELSGKIALRFSDNYAITNEFIEI